MHVSLLLVGAHNGQKQSDLIRRSAAHGVVILIEPVPFLFAALSLHWSDVPNVVCLNCCVATETGKISFHAPTPEAINVHPAGDQLGSTSAGHAIRHEPALAAHIVEIEVEAVTFLDIVRHFGITSLDILFTDTEGYDAKLLPRFPFELLRPGQIVFEYKHADGTFNIGRELGRLLIMLDEVGYDMRIVDLENCVAVLRPTHTLAAATRLA
jgi:FkbM family methyltransferase